jgi:DNA-binding SARP family transcriptional activator
LREACLGALRVLVSHYAATSPPRAITFGQRAIEIDPLLEDVHCALMECYARQGDRAAAARQYERLKQALRDHLNIEPAETAQALYRKLLSV